MDPSQNCVFLILFANQREGNPQSPGVQVNRKHHQVTKHLKRSAETQGGIGNSPPLPFCRARWAVGVWAKTTKQTPCKSHSATGNVQWRKVSSMSGNLRVIWQLALFFSKPWLPETLLLPCWLQNCTPLVCAPSEAAVNAHTVAAHRWCVLFPAVGPTSLTGCRRGRAEGGNSTAACSLWPRYDCRPIWAPEPTRVNLSPIGASGTVSRPWNPSASRLRPRHNSCRPRVSTTSSRVCTPGEVGQGESRPVVQLFACVFILAKWQTWYLPQCIFSKLSGQGNGCNRV